jgi:hypothetical protein
MPNLQNQSLGESGQIVTTGDANTVTSTMILDGTILNADINASANIALSKIATGTAGNILVYNGSGVLTSVTESGDITIDSSGVTSITANSIVNADINSAAAIAYSKLSLANTIVNADINASAGIALSKLATSTAGNIIVYNASGVPTAVAETGDVTISDTGVTAIAANTIVNADINTAAAIAYSKLSLANTIVNADISTAAAIAHSKLANATVGQVLLGTTTTGVITATTISGDVTITGAGLTAIAANSIVNADINSAAAINTTKITNWENDQIVLSNQIFG